MFEETAKSVHEILHHSTSPITHLNLETSLYSQFDIDGQDHGQKKLAFNKIVSSKVFPRLESTVLRGWLFTLKDLESFPLAHAGTLRELHLINCSLAEASESELSDSIRLKLQPALALTGVEIYALIQEHHCDEGFLREGPEWPGEFESVSRLQLPSNPKFTYPGPRKDLEELFMGGRPNVVAEVKQQISDVKAFDDWWSERISPDATRIEHHPLTLE